MHASEWAERVAHLGTLVRWEGTLELRLRTLAALAVGRHFQAQCVWGIQGVIGAVKEFVCQLFHGWEKRVRAPSVLVFFQRFQEGVHLLSETVLFFRRPRTLRCQIRVGPRYRI